MWFVCLNRQEAQYTLYTKQHHALLLTKYCVTPVAHHNSVQS